MAILLVKKKRASLKLPGYEVCFLLKFAVVGETIHIKLISL